MISSRAFDTNKTQFKPEIWNSLNTEYERCLQLQPFETSWSGTGATAAVPRPNAKLANAPPVSPGILDVVNRKILQH